jgi:hypothetical protein
LLERAAALALLAAHWFGLVVTPTVVIDGTTVTPLIVATQVF